MVIAILHIDVQLDQVAAWKRLREICHLDVQSVSGALLIVQLTHQVHMALQTVHHESPVPVGPSHYQVGHLAILHSRILMARWA